MDDLKTLDNLRDVKNLFQHKLDLYNFLKNEMLFLYKIIISTLNNVQTNFMIKKIGSEEYNKNLSNINKLYEKYTVLLKEIKLEGLEDNIFYEMKLKITELTMELKEFTLKSSASSIIDMLKLFYTESWESDMNEQILENINLYNDIFIPTSCMIESKINYLSDITDVENGHIFFKKLLAKKHNIIEEIHGARLYVYINKKVMSLSGYFKNDNMNIIRDNKLFTPKSEEVNELLKLEVMIQAIKVKY